jgi:hypothetical protein
MNVYISSRFQDLAHLFNSAFDLSPFTPLPINMAPSIQRPSKSNQSKRCERRRNIHQLRFYRLENAVMHLIYRRKYLLPTQ